MNIGHCFGEDTQILVDLGDGKGPHDAIIKNLVNSKFKVLNENGEWIDATAKYCGQKETFKMTMNHNNLKHHLEVLVTENQVWPTEDWVYQNGKWIGDGVKKDKTIKDIWTSHQGFLSAVIYENLFGKNKNPDNVTPKFDKVLYIGMQNSNMVSKQIEIFIKKHNLVDTYCIELYKPGYFALGNSWMYGVMSGIMTAGCNEI